MVATQADVRRIALSLPASSEEPDYFAFRVDARPKPKWFAWVWLERIHPKKTRVPNPAVLAVRVRDQDEKAMLLAADPDKFFTEDHYNGYPAVLVRLAKVTATELRKLLADAWECQAPKSRRGASVKETRPKAKTKTKTKPTTTRR